jgi:hypothetical protein
LTTDPTTMSNVLYVLSNPAIKGLCKVGIHRGSLKQLLGRYSTYIPNVKVHLFIRNVNARTIENKFKKSHEKYRVPIKHTGRMSEWFAMELIVIIAYILPGLINRKYGLHDNNKEFVIDRLNMSIENGTKVIVAKEKNNKEES